MLAIVVITIIIILTELVAAINHVLIMVTEMLFLGRESKACFSFLIFQSSVCIDTHYNLLPFSLWVASMRLSSFIGDLSDLCLVQERLYLGTPCLILSFLLMSLSENECVSQSEQVEVPQQRIPFMSNFQKTFT